MLIIAVFSLSMTIAVRIDMVIIIISRSSTAIVDVLVISAAIAFQ